MATTLRSILDRLPMQELQAMLKWAEYSQVAHAFTRHESIDCLVKHVFDRDLKKTWTLLLPIEQLAVAEAIYNNEGYILPGNLKTKYDQELIVDKNDPAVKNKKKVLKIRLFLFKTYGDDCPIPEDLIKKLKAFVKKPKSSKIDVLQEPSQYNPNIEGQQGQLKMFNAQTSVLYDLRSILWLIKNDTLKIGVTGVPTVGLTKKISQMLLAPDYFADNAAKLKNIRGFAWMILMKAAKLVTYQKETVILTKEGESILKNPPDVKTIKMIFDVFMNNDDFDEASRIDTMANTKQGGYWDRTEFTDSAARRRAVIETLKSTMEGTPDSSGGGPWIRMTEFLKYLRLQRPRFQVADRLGNMSCGRQGVSVDLLPDHWFVLEGTYVKCLLMEFLANLGMIEINYSVPVFCENPPKSKYSFDFLSAYDGLYEFRVTALGAYCIGLTKQEPQIDMRPEKIFHVTPNLEVTSVVDHMIPLDVMLLNLCTDKVNGKTWRLNTQKLLNVIDDKNGFLPQFKAFLYERALSAIPKTVEHFFEDIERRVNYVSLIEPAHVYLCQEKALAQLISHDAKTKQFCSLTGENNLVVPIKTEQEFKAGLKKVGYIVQQAAS